MKVSRSGYYGWIERGSRLNGNFNIELLSLISKIFYERNEAYRYRRITIEIAKRTNEKINPKTTKRYMDFIGIKSKCRRTKKPRESKNLKDDFSNKLNGSFQSTKPLTKIYTDITQVRTLDGWMYLSITVDGYNWEILDFQINLNKGNIISIKNITETLKLVNKDHFKNVIIHSDRGSEYTSLDMKEINKKYMINQSMGRKGCSLDNRPAEYFFPY